MTFNPALDSLLIAEALKAASLEDIAAELRRRAKLCDDMASDCNRFADHEDDPVRRETHESAASAFMQKAARYRMAYWELLGGVR